MAAVTELTTAPAGSGKSYMRVRRIIDEYLPQTEARIITDLPLKVDEIAKHVKRSSDLDSEEVYERIELIDRVEMQAWRNDSLVKGAEPEGPWVFFEDRDISGCRIIIDELHNYCGVHSQSKVKARWMEFLGELRHRGATFEGITQHPAKLAKEVLREAEVRRSLVNSETRRDPFFRIIMSDWYELRAGFFTREYTVTISEIEKRTIDGRERNECAFKVTRDPYYFQFYDSYNAPSSSGQGVEAPKREYEKRSRMGLARWFLRRNVFRIMPRLALVCLVCWACFFGGSKKMFAGYMHAFTSFAPVASEEEEKREDVTPRKIESRGQADRVLVEGASLPENYVASLTDETAQELAMSHSARLALEQLVENLKAEREQLIEQNDEMKALVNEAFSLALLTEEKVTFKGGFTYRVGDVIDMGPFEGLAIREIDWQRRLVYLSDTSILRLGAPANEGWQVKDMVSDIVPDLPGALGQ